ncbi:MAG TPA: hypothetical protein VKB26_11030 [Candidatus Acidoferrales bacterium]|nr:hypothetical protein [Candidatus Acidoferrales bacterium]
MISLSPKGIFRIAVNVCLVGWGGSLIYLAIQASHVGQSFYQVSHGAGFDGVGLARELSIFFFFGVAVFALFYGEYQMVQWLGKRELNRQLGYLQALSCSIILILGILAICVSHWRPGNPLGMGSDAALVIILIFGHGVFLGNVIWSYAQERRVS